MAELVSAEDLTEFLESLRTMERAASVYNASDLVGLEICERRLEKHTRLLIAVTEEMFEVLRDSLAV